MRVLAIQLSPTESLEMLLILDRGLRTMEPVKWPVWVQPLLSMLEGNETGAERYTYTPGEAMSPEEAARTPR